MEKAALAAAYNGSPVTPVASDESEIQLELLAEKKGVFIKHVEYKINNGHKSVTRRYNDFVALNDALLVYYPTRLVPRLPPKRAITDQEFIEERRKALCRYLGVLQRHPVLRSSPILAHFLAYDGADLLGSLRQLTKPSEDEFTSYPLDKYASINVASWAHKPALWKQNMSKVEKAWVKLVSTMESLVRTSKDTVKNFMAMNLDLNALCEQNTSPFLEFVTHPNAITRHPGTDFIADIANEVSGVTKQWLELATAEEGEVLDQILLMKDLVKGWKELATRFDKAAAADQRALTKLPVVNGKSSPTKIEEKANTVAIAENRLRFGFHCMEQEMGFLQESLGPLMTSFLRKFVQVEKTQAAKIAVAWEDVYNIVDKCPLPNTRTPVAPSAPEFTGPVYPSL